ncbi:hypothetical protein [Streptomyces sp. NPDC090029]|uniref:hypothetical protein n=1 Tax=Streptomyces sp. NPDC090029 TaxID=3365924 RepID=UPI00380ADBAA
MAGTRDFHEFTGTPTAPDRTSADGTIRRDRPCTNGRRRPRRTAAAQVTAALLHLGAAAIRAENVGG